MPNNQRSRKLELRAFQGLAVRLATPLLAFALMHCGGKESAQQAASGGASVAGESSTAPTANGGSSAAGSAGQAGRSSDGFITLPVGGATATVDCNTVSDTITRSTSTVIADNPPEPKGGAISNGIYFLTKREDYVGPNGNSSRAPDGASGILAISESTGVSVDLQINWMELSGELPTHTKWSESVVIAGATYSYTVTCPIRDSTETGSLSFTATTDELIWFAPLPSGGTRVETFERQAAN